MGAAACLEGVRALCTQAQRHAGLGSGMEPKEQGLFPDTAVKHFRLREWVS